MKVAITTQAEGWDAKIDPRFGRARGFWIIDTDTGEAEFIDNNENFEAAHGAGTSSAQKMIENKVNVLISGSVGPKAGSVLKAAGIKIYLTNENLTVREAFDRFKNNKLTEMLN